MSRRSSWIVTTLWRETLSWLSIDWACAEELFTATVVHRICQSKSSILHRLQSPSAFKKLHISVSAGMSKSSTLGGVFTKLHSQWLRSCKGTPRAQRRFCIVTWKHSRSIGALEPLNNLTLSRTGTHKKNMQTPYRKNQLRPKPTTIWLRGHSANHYTTRSYQYKTVSVKALWVFI